MRKFRGFGIFIFLGVFAAATAIVMLLWNSVVVNVFSVGEINFWYSAGLILLCKILFGGFHKGFHAFRGHHHDCCGHDRHGSHSKDRSNEDMFREMHERFHAMSAKQRREHILKHMGRGLGGWCDNKEEDGTSAGEQTPPAGEKTDE